MGMLSAEDVESAVYDKTEKLSQRVAELQATLYNANLQKGILTSAYIFRKQAEAVEACEKEFQGQLGVIMTLSQIAESLRQQADDLERKQ